MLQGSGVLTRSDPVAAPPAFISFAVAIDVCGVASGIWAGSMKLSKSSHNTLSSEMIAPARSLPFVSDSGMSVPLSLAI